MILLLQLYIDPVDGYVFRSKKDVFRYLQTGDISSCAIRPVKRDLDAAMTDSSVSHHIPGSTHHKTHTHTPLLVLFVG